MNSSKLQLSELKLAIVRNPLTVSPQATLTEAIAQMVAGRSQCSVDYDAHNDFHRMGISCVLIVEESQVIGILTERDVVRLITQSLPIEQLTVSDVMTHPVITLRESDFSEVLSAIKIFQQHHIRHLPIVDEQDHLVGMLTHESLRQVFRPFELLRLRLVGEVMTNHVICASPEASMWEIAQQMTEYQVSCVVIVEPLATQTSLLKPVGILTERDLVQLQSEGINLKQQLANTRMSRPVFTVQPDDSLWAVQQRMEQKLIRRLVVTGAQGELLGIVTQSNVLKVFNPLEAYSLAQMLEARVLQLEAEKADILADRTAELERLVEERTASLRIAAEREKLVAEIADRIRVSLDLQEILDICVSEVRAFLQCDRVLVYQFQPDWSGIIIAESVAQGLSLSLGNHIQDSCFQEQTTNLYSDDQPIFVNNIYTAGYADCHVQLLEQYQVKANLVVPIRVSGQLWGLLIGHQCQEFRQWQTSDISLLRNISVQLAIAIQQSNAYQQLQNEINEQKKSELELRRTEKLFREAQRIASLGNWELDLRTNHLYWSDEIFQIFEIDQQQFGATYEAFVNAIHPDDREMVNDAYTQHLSDRHPYKIVHRLLMSDGRIKYVQEQCETTYDLDGMPMVSQGTVQDITQLKETELQLQELNQELELRVQAQTQELLQVNSLQQAILNSTDYAIVSTDLNGIVKTFNAGAERMSGYQASELIDIANILSLHDQQELSDRTSDISQELGVEITDDEMLGAMTAKGVEREEEWISIRKDGSRFPSIISIKPLKDNNDQVIGFVGIARDITEQKAIERDRQLAEAALKQSEIIFRRVFEFNVVGMIFTDFTGRINRANDRFLEMLGYTREELESGQINWQQMTPPEYIPQDLVAINHLSTHESIDPWEKAYYHKDGHYVYVLVGATMISAQDCVAVIVDISDLKKSENALRESQQFIQTVFDSFPLAVFWKDLNSVYLGCNEIFLQTTGFSSTSEIVGKNDFDFPYTLEQVRGFRADDRQVMQSRIPKYFIEEKLTMPTGEVRWLETNKVPLQDVDGNIIGVLGTFQDITRRKQIEQQLQQSRDQFQRLVTDIGDQFIFFSHSGAEGILNYISAGSAPILGIKCEDAIGKCWVEIAQWNLEDLQKTSDILQQMMAGAIDFNQLDLRFTHADGTERILRVSAHPIRDSDGNLIAVEGLGEDITESHKAQQLLLEMNQKLAISNDQLERATRLKDEFLANMSHELRTPLNAILGITEGFQEGTFGTLNDQQERMLQVIASSGSHLLDLINDILDLAKIEAGKLTLELAMTNIEQLSKDSAVFVRQQATQKKVQLQIQVAQSLPQLVIDERRIRQALINLLNNAVKFTPEGGRVTLEITVQEAIANNPNPDKSKNNITHWVNFAVIDTGIGIAPEPLKTLFQPFVQVDSSLNRQYEGTGLGLSLVKRIVEMHGGYVKATSTVGVGSCFTIALPYNQLDVTISQPLVRTSTAVSSHIDACIAPPCSPLILLAEDNEANIVTVFNYLVAKGYRVIIAKDGQMAIAMVQAEQPDLVLMDVQMPTMDGLEAMQWLRSHNFTMPIIALTALAMTGDRDKCLAAGASDYLSKPIKLKQLATLIQKWL
ncbi:PAS domain S-box protein [Pseudanabaena yagii]|uniref:histidine kinase n=1 Tax=Pseudanabaena yagii GIHE-NHR1 TaxID=2722753 RepID=A0ABX1LSF1_9CYAN|nr:PAS domain S-box protein [Pseudanabaena yagii]NMF58261.1 PAS domain S-box protein [Pseudanabaena yagii GIHE-NHR1]